MIYITSTYLWNFMCLDIDMLYLYPRTKWQHIFLHTYPSEMAV